MLPLMRPVRHKNGHIKLGKSPIINPYDRITVRTRDFRSRIAIFGPEILERRQKDVGYSVYFRA